MHQANYFCKVDVALFIDKELKYLELFFKLKNIISSRKNSFYLLRRFFMADKKRKNMNTEIQDYNNKLSSTDKEICDILATTIDNELSEAEKESASFKSSEAVCVLP